MKFAKYANKKQIYGYEFLSGIPGTIGGSIKMNAGCYGREMSNILHEVTIIDRNKGLCNLPSKKLNMTYRNTKLSRDAIIISAKLKYYKDNKDFILPSKFIVAIFKTFTSNLFSIACFI